MFTPGAAIAPCNKETCNRSRDRSLRRSRRVNSALDDVHTTPGRAHILAHTRASVVMERIESQDGVHTAHQGSARLRARCERCVCADARVCEFRMHV